MNELRQPQKLPKINLRTIPRSPRMTAVLAARAYKASQAGAFTQAIYHRYGVRSAEWPRLGLVFQHSMAEETTNHLYHLHLTPRFFLTLQRPAISTPALPVQPLATTVVQQIGGGFIQEDWRVEKVVERLFAREVRVDSVTVGNATAVANPLAVPVTARAIDPSPLMITPPTAQPTARIVRHSALEAGVTPQPALAASQWPSRTEPQVGPAGPAWRTATAPAAVALSGAEVNRLADQVIQVIDRRITAHRERLGGS